jgi:hypothetical protein
MALEWWERIDREPEREALRRLIPLGGCLVLEGDDESGRPQAADLIDEDLQGFGYKVVVADLGIGRPVSVRALLLEVWKELAPAPAPGDLPVWVQRAGSLTTGFITAELRKLATDERVALLLIDIDSTEALMPHEVSALSDLARQTRWIVVITSSRESASPWQALGTRDKRLALGDFSYDDVLMALQRAPELGKRGPDDLERAAQSVLAASGGPIRPSVAYTVLKAWSLGDDGPS